MSFTQTPKDKSAQGFRKAKMGDQENNLAGIQTDIKYIQRDIGEIKTAIKEGAALTVARREFDEYCKNTDDKIKDLNDKKASQEQVDFWVKVISFTAGTVFIEIIRTAFSYFHK